MCSKFIIYNSIFIVPVATLPVVYKLIKYFPLYLILKIIKVFSIIKNTGPIKIKSPKYKTGTYLSKFYKRILNIFSP